MKDRTIKKAMKRYTVAFIVVMLAIAAIIVISITDEKTSIDFENQYIQKDPKPEEDARKYIPVEYGQFVTLLKSFEQSHHVSLVMGDPVFDKKDGVTMVSISKGYTILTEKNENAEKPEWCTGTQCFFKTIVVNETDTVVSCPADLLVRFVEDYENRHTFKKK